MIIRNQDDYTVSLAHYLPSGDLWSSRNVQETTFYKLLYGLALILLDVDIQIEDFKKEFYPVNTVKFLDEWESLLGIPDNCLSSRDTTEERTKHIIGALGALGCVTKEDWINLAAIMGYEIEINYMSEETAWPWVWPHVWGGTEVQNRFIMVITIKNVVLPTQGVWPWIWPHAWGEDETKPLRCIFSRIKAAHTLITYKYEE